MGTVQVAVASLQCTVNVGPPPTDRKVETRNFQLARSNAARPEESRPILHGSGKRNMMAYPIECTCRIGMRVCVCVCV